MRPEFLRRPKARGDRGDHLRHACRRGVLCWIGRWTPITTAPSSPSPVLPQPSSKLLFAGLAALPSSLTSPPRRACIPASAPPTLSPSCPSATSPSSNARCWPARPALEIWKRYQVPVYFYEAAAARPDRALLEEVRRGQFEGLRDAVLREPARRPDVGGPVAASHRRSLRRGRAPLPHRP